ncbi:undecaprenyl/decaprenyl-phosphate alpha-N-acetylglucosaminyl 1-phosphate transferase [Pelagibacterales bacterium SAG-MED06]|nr:undecaprenyl/decaprenyl-phosphate alpha-N-acetylglucosaminyl 1-phosphate transferase [Pelagibacterales bacterium SAG-MED06]
MNIEIAIFTLLSFFLLFICTKISYKFNLVDLPNKRKIHSKPTAYTGGITLSIIYLLAISLFKINDIQLQFILFAGFIISIVGLIDDEYNLNIIGKLILQLLPILYLIFFRELALTSMGDYYYFKLNLGDFKIVFTLLASLLLINAFNYFDGIDGSLTFSSFSVLAILYYLIADESLRLFLNIILIPLSIFLFFNFSLLKLPKLFLGDGGSLLIGFVISFILVYSANQKLAHPILLAWSVVVFVYEFLSVNIHRLKNKKNIFRASQDHLHHLLLKKNKSVIFTNILIMIINLLMFIIGYFTYILLGPLSSFSMFVFCFIIFYYIRNYFLVYNESN